MGSVPRIFAKLLVGAFGRLRRFARYGVERVRRFTLNRLVGILMRIQTVPQSVAHGLLAVTSKNPACAMRRPSEQIFHERPLHKKNSSATRRGDPPGISR